METFELNGTTYKTKPKEEITEEGKRILSWLTNSPYFVLASAFMYGNSKSDPIAGIDLIAEYGKIQNKESRLSKSKRDLVVERFENLFIKIEASQASN
jgi:hypothetical protein